MRVAYTSVNVEYCSPELGQALLNAIISIKDVADGYRERVDDRTLVVLLTCPCCYSTTEDRELFKNPGSVLVSPWRGAVNRDGEIRQVAKYPPFDIAGRKRGEGCVAATIEEFLEDFKNTIETALTAP